MKRQLSYLFSLLLIAIYALCTMLAMQKYPAPYSPSSNWLSDLGSRTLNPQGWYFYNGGIIASGICLFIFFWGFSVWKKEVNKKQRMMLKLAQGFGFAGAFSMVLSAAYPINMPGIHSFFSAALYILIGTSFVFSVVALVYYPKFPKWMFVLGLIIAVEDMLWGMVFNFYIMEWITVGLLLGFVLLLGLFTRMRQNDMEREK